MTLEFNLDDPDDMIKARQTMATSKLIGSLYDYIQSLREVRRYSADDLDVEYAEKWNETLNEILYDHSIDLEDLYC